jgi:hypothetical protein
MAQTKPSLPSRLALAFRSFFSILGRADFAAAVARLEAGGAIPSPAPEPAEPKAQDNSAALQLLGLLQREARFIDFIAEDVAAYSDADIGAAARLVHEGCRRVLTEHFELAPVRPEAEGSRITLAAGFDAAAIRLTGNVVGEPPFAGSITHRGWRVTASRLPRLTGSHDPSILAQAEVEL